jgi:hypothetical protein
MGATFPFMMAFMREDNHNETRSFSFLYVANVLGALILFKASSRHGKISLEEPK